MRNVPNVKAERCRIRRGELASDSSYGNNGAFTIPAPGIDLGCIVSDGSGWDHVSVSTASRCPTWEEMVLVRNLFFADDEWAVQYGPPPSANINCHPFCLHWWRPQTAAEIEVIQVRARAIGSPALAPPCSPPGDFPRPPSWMVWV